MLEHDTDDGIPEFLRRSPGDPAQTTAPTADNTLPTGTTETAETGHTAADISTPKPKGWRAHLPIHPAADLFPLMAEGELRDLADDIERNGVLTPVALYNDKDLGLCVLDGRNRLDALVLLDLPAIMHGRPACDLAYVGMDAPDFDPFAYVLSTNIHRRHLTGEQKREIIAKLLKAKPEASNRQIAEQVKASHVTVGAVRTGMEATGQIDQLEKTTGKDGKKRPTQKKGKSKGATAIKPVLAKQDAMPVTYFSPTDECERTASSLKAQHILLDAENTKFDSSGLSEWNLEDLEVLAADERRRILDCIRETEKNIGIFKQRLAQIEGAT